MNGSPNPWPCRSTRTPNLDTCMALARLARIRRDRRAPRHIWTAEDLASLQHPPKTKAWRELRDRFRSQFRYRQWRLSAPAQSILDSFHPTIIERGELGIRLGKAVAKACKTKPDGPKQVKKEHLDVYGLLPLDDLRQLVLDMERGEPRTIDSESLLQIAGPGLAEAWTERFGKPRKASGLANRERLVCKLAKFEKDSGRVTQRKLNQEKIHIVEPPILQLPKLKNTARGFRRLGLVAILTFSLGLTGYLYTDPGLRAYRLFREKGIAPALKQLKSEIDSLEKGNYAWYLLGHSYFLNGDYDKAKNIALETLAETKKIMIAGDCYYLLGSIALVQGKKEQAIGHLKNAKEQYGDNFIYRSFNSDVSIASITPGSKALDLLDSLLPMVQDSGIDLNRHYYWYIRMKIESRLGKYAPALNSAYRSQDLAATENELAKIYSEMSFIHIAQGNIDEGLRLSDQAAAVFAKEGDLVGSMYNEVNTLAVRRCMSQPFGLIEKKIRDFANQTNDHQLLVELNRALGLECVISEI